MMHEGKQSAHDWNIAYLLDFKEFDGGYIVFGGGAYGGRITECLRHCLVAKATLDESMLWHRRLGHINFKNINKLVKDNLVRGLPIKHFENYQTCVACLKGKQYRAFSKVLKEYSIARTPQQNGVAERRNRTLIKAARTMLADSKLPTTFWAEAISTACYVQNRVLVVKPHNKTPFELFRGFKPALSFMRPFGCHVIILNTLDNLGKFDGKSDEGFFVGYSLSSKAFRVYNTRTRKVEENLHIGFLKNKPMIEGNGTQGEFSAGTSEAIRQDCIMIPIWKDASYFDSPSKDDDNGEPRSAADDQKQDGDGPDNQKNEQDKFEDDSSPKEVNTTGQHVNAASPKVNTGHLKLNIVGPSVNTASSNDQESPKDMFTMGASHSLKATHVEFFSEEEVPEIDLGNITNSYSVPTTPNTRIHKDHPIENVIGDVKTFVQTKRITKPTSKQGFLSDVEAIQEELIQFKLQKVWILVDLPKGHKAIGTKWIFRNKKDKRGVVIRNKARLVAQGLTQEEGIDYDEVIAPVAKIEAIRLFLAYTSFIGFMVYQMDVKSAFLYGQIEEEVYVCQPLGFEDPNYPEKVYKVVKALYGLHQAPRAWYETLANYLLGNGFQRGKIDQTLFIKKQKGDILLMSSMGELTFFLGLQVKQKEDGVYISQDKYVAEILKKFNYTDVKYASTQVDLKKPLVKDGDANDVDVHLYRSMIGSLMYLTTSRPDIMFVVCVCARFQVTPKTSHLLAVKRIFRYLKGKPTLGLWYSRNSPFELVAYTDSDYARATQDRKSTTGGCFDAGSKECMKGHLTSDKSIKHIGKSNEVGTLRYLSLVVPLKKVGDEAVHKELVDRMEKAATTASSLEAE
ncbi:putative ribonuclease H-like domain-containing protein [Tanacetum coccineum]